MLANLRDAYTYFQYNQGCVVRQQAGDVLFFASDVRHTTQNHRAHRTAFSMSVWRDPPSRTSAGREGL